MINKKVVVDARMIYSSGIGRYLRNILPNIIESFSEVILIGNMNQLKPLYGKYSNITMLECNEGIYSLKAHFQLSQLIPISDIYWTPHFNLPLLPIKSTNIVCTIHDAYHLSKTSDFGLIKRLYSKILFNNALKRSQKVITVSNFSKNEILKYTYSSFKEKIKVIYNDLDALFLNTNTTTDVSVFKDYILYVGNVKKHKNLVNAIRAFQQSKEKGIIPNINFLIVGKKNGFIDQDKKLDEILQHLDSSIVFTDTVNDETLLALYSNAKALIFPSLYEGFGYPPLEAMAMGCPTLVSNVASIPEICKDGSIYFDPLDVNEMSNCIDSIFLDEQLKNKLIQKGYEVVKNYQNGQMVDSHLQLFKSLL